MATELWIQIDDTWIPILSIPTNQFDRFTLHPLKWLRFLDFIIYGREGILRTHCDGPEVDNYDIGTSQLREGYYFFSAGKLSSFCPSSLLIFVSRSTSLHRYSRPSWSRIVSELHLQFKTRGILSQRHSSRSNLHRNRQTCRAMQSISLSATLQRWWGTFIIWLWSFLVSRPSLQYIQQLTTIRGNSDNDVIDEINDPKNGFLLDAILHILVGSGKSAFIQVRSFINALSRTIMLILLSETPNFGLTRRDIPPSPRIVPAVHAERLTLQHFYDPPTTDRAQENQDARLPETHRQ